MSLSAEERLIMSNLEMERAERILASEIPVALSAKLWNLLANRLYYAAFHAVSGLLIRNKIQVGSHKGAFLMFNEKFVLIGKFTSADRRLYSNLENLRDKGDYNCSLEIEEEEIVQYVELTQLFVAKVKQVMQESL